MALSSRRNTYIGIGLALLAVIFWSGNFIIARGVVKQIPPVSLAFYRWLLASLIIMPFAIRPFKTEWPVVKQSWHYLFWASLTGIAFLLLRGLHSFNNRSWSHRGLAQANPGV